MHSAVRHTMPSNVFLMTLEGNIGAGKSTLLHAVAALDHADIVVVQEPVDLWCEPSLPDGTSMLAAYYSAPAKTAMAFQMYTMLTRARSCASDTLSSSATLSPDPARSSRSSSPVATGASVDA